MEEWRQKQTRTTFNITKLTWGKVDGGKKPTKIIEGGRNKRKWAEEDD